MNAGIYSFPKGADEEPSTAKGLLQNLVEFWGLYDAGTTKYGQHAGLNLGNPSSYPTVAGLGGSLATDCTAGSGLGPNSSTALQVGDFDFSFCGWVKFDSLATNPRVLSKRLNATTSHEFDLYVGTNALEFELRNAAGTNFGVSSGASTISTGNWYLFYCAHDAANNLLLISLNNGTVVRADTLGRIPTTNTSNFFIGQLQQVSRPLDGQVQRVGFWKRLLTATELTFLYNEGRGRDYPFA